MQKYYPGAVVRGTVVSIKPYGAFISLDDNVNGLLHISEMLAKTKHLYNANKILAFASDWAEEEGITDSEMYAELAASSDQTAISESNRYVCEQDLTAD